MLFSVAFINIAPSQQLSGTSFLRSLLCITALATAALSLWAVASIMDRRRLRVELDSIAVQKQLQYDAMQQQMQNIDKMHLFQHDVQNNYVVLQGYLDRGEVEAARSYLENLTEHSAKLVERYADNPVADVVLNHAAQMCKASNIAFTVEGMLPLENMIPPTDFAPLLQNMLSNAMEAAAQAPEPRHCHVHFSTQAKHLCITVRNSAAGALPAPGESTKQDKRQHGFGLRIIKEITDKYDGLYALKQDGNEATASAMVCAREGGGQNRANQ